MSPSLYRFDRRRGAAFTLIEIAVVTAIIGVLSLALLPAYVDYIEGARVDAERRSEEALAEDVQRSFQETDWNRNLAALPGSVPTESADQITLCGGGELLVSPHSNSWFYKIARLRGITPTIDAPVSEDQQKSVYDLAINAYSQPRLFVAGPADEPGQQRYLLLSLMAPPSKGLVIPANDGSAAWFDAIWNNNWESKGGALPTDWTARLNPEQQAAWSHGRGTTTNVSRLIVRRIVQPRYRITVNNTHPLYTAWVYYNGAIQATCPKDSPPYTTPEIPAGRLVIVRRGPDGSTFDTATEAYRFYLNENSTITIQP